MEDPCNLEEASLPREAGFHPLPKSPEKEPLVNLLGHCPFCLTKVSTSRTELASVNFLWPYLHFGEKFIFSPGINNEHIPNFVFLNNKSAAVGEAVKGNVPSMCKTCFEEVKILKGVHESLAMIRNTLKAQVNRLHKIILETENGKAVYDTGKWKFERELRKNANDAFIKGTLTFLEFIRLGINKKEIANDEEEKDLGSRNSPMYPLTSCELLLPVENQSPEDIEGAMESDDSSNPDVKIEQPSDAEEDADNFTLLSEETVKKIRGSKTPMNQNKRTRRSSGTRRKTYKPEFSCYSNRSGESESEEDTRERQSDHSDPEFAVNDETMMDVTSNSESENSDASVPEKDPLSELATKSRSPNKPVQTKTRGRGRPCKYPVGRPPSRRGRKGRETVLPNVTPLLVLQKAPGQARTYLCDVCKDDFAFTFTSEKAVARHKVEIHGADPFKCKTCGEIFYTPRSLFNHEKRKHPETTPDRPQYFCELCNKPFSSRFYVEQHKKVVHFKEKPYFCEHCDKRFTSQLGRNGHIKAFHLLEKFDCTVCNNTYRFKHILERHQEKFHPDMPEVVERLKAKEERAKLYVHGENVDMEESSNFEESDEGESTLSLKNEEPLRESGEIETAFKTAAPDEKKMAESSANPQKPKRGRPRKNRTHVMPLTLTSTSTVVEGKCNLCPDLDRVFTEAALKLHKYQVHGQELDLRLPCRLCKNTFPTERSFKYHQKTYHPDAKPDSIEIPCPECDKTFSAMYTLQIHQRVVHRKEILFECKECSKAFVNQIGLKAHMLAIHLGKRWYCDICNKEFKYPAGIKRHKIEVHKIEFEGKKPKKNQGVFTCTVCKPLEEGKAPTFKTEKLFNHHMITFHGADPFFCPHCEAKFPWRNQMLNHVKNVHEKGNEQDKDATSSKQPKEKPIYTCEHCGKQYLCKENLKIHLQKLHDPDWPKKAKPFVCELCGKSYIHKSGYKCHMKMQHRSHTQHICEVCGKSFRNPYYLADHMQNHTLLRTHHCPHCPARFKRRDTWKKHIRLVHNRTKQRNVGIRRMHFRRLEDDEPNAVLRIPTSAAAVPDNMSSKNITEDTSQSVGSNTAESESSENFQNVYG